MDFEKTTDLFVISSSLVFGTLSGIWWEQQLNDLQPRKSQDKTNKNPRVYMACCEVCQFTSTVFVFAFADGVLPSSVTRAFGEGEAGRGPSEKTTISEQLAQPYRLLGCVIINGPVQLHTLTYRCPSICKSGSRVFPLPGPKQQGQGHVKDGNASLVQRSLA